MIRKKASIIEKDDSKNKNMSPGIAWYRDRWRYFYEWKEIEKGRYKGMIELDLVHEKLKVYKVHIKRYPQIKEKIETIVVKNRDPNDITRLSVIVKEGKIPSKKIKKKRMAKKE